MSDLPRAIPLHDRQRLLLPAAEIAWQILVNALRESGMYQDGQCYKKNKAIDVIREAAREWLLDHEAEGTFTLSGCCEILRVTGSVEIDAGQISRAVAEGNARLLPSSMHKPRRRYTRSYGINTARRSMSRSTNS